MRPVEIVGVPLPASRAPVTYETVGVEVSSPSDGHAPGLLAGPSGQSFLAGDSVATTTIDLRPSLSWYLIGGAISGSVMGLVGAAIYGAVKDTKPSYTKGAGFGALAFAGLGAVRWATMPSIPLTVKT